MPWWETALLGLFAVTWLALVVRHFRRRTERDLAQVLRIACAPGRNLAQARFNAKRSLKG